MCSRLCKRDMLPDHDGRSCEDVEEIERQREEEQEQRREEERENIRRDAVDVANRAVYDSLLTNVLN